MTAIQAYCFVYLCATLTIFVQGIVYGRPNCCSNLYDLGLIELLELCVVYNR